MVFSSFSFIFVFLPALLAVYFIVPARLRELRNIILLGFSIFFYACGGPKFLSLIVVSVLINYSFALPAAPGGSPPRRKAALVIAVIANLALLGFYKYAVFTVENINRLGAGFPVPEITLPIGISFFTFQGMSYLIDVYRGDAPAERNPLRVALYIFLFPQLVAGPIVRYTTIADEIHIREESTEDFASGSVRFCFGLAKKMLVANVLGELADAVFSTTPADLTSSLAWLGALAYTGQIYFDFSAYSDMAIGLGKIFGFHFLENFNYPYISKSITEFWRRWHISLSTWFRDYLYIPLGGNRCKISRQIFNILVVWTLTGLWHGAAWNFIVWGVYFAVLLLGERFVWGRILDRVPKFISHIYTMLLVVLSWVLFRSQTIGYALGMIKAMFGAGFADGRTVYYLKEYWWVLAAGTAAALPVKTLLERVTENNGDKHGFLPFIGVWGPKLAALVLLVLSYIRLVGSSFNPFIYFRF
ncbi:MAG: MBOAT family protein [Clostridiales bacterium]|nr:MBOAT family protein [Clostridiales bacterium]